jgi:hypothetical protein
MLRPARSRLATLLVGMVPVACLFAAVPAPVCTQEVIARVGTAVVTRTSGGPIKVGTGPQSLGGRSTLELDWIMIADSTLGLVFDEPAGAFGSPATGSWFRLGADLRLRSLKPVTAFEIRILTFNVWREFTGTLSFTQLEDFKPLQKKRFERFWGVYTEEAIREHQISVAYVARVRLEDGTVIAADLEPVLETARAIQGSFTTGDLEPTIQSFPPATIGGRARRNRDTAQPHAGPTRGSPSST